MLPNFSNQSLALLSGFIESLSVGERSCLVSLSRSQLYPAPHDKVLLSKCRPVLDRLVVDPPYEGHGVNTLTEIGEILYTLITTPYLTGLVIVLCMGASIPEAIARDIRYESFNKELLATQTRRKPSTWDWKTLLWGDWRRGDIIHPLFPEVSPLQLKFAQSLHRFKRHRLSHKIIKPHYSRRGVSSETQGWIMHRRSRRNVKYGNPNTFHRDMDEGDINSKDVIHHYIRTGCWPSGRVEMRQRWYPSYLKPRTYFAWGGHAIRSSTYLREFFNLVADCFAPTQRHNRVKADWLRVRSSTHHPRFFFYDLTSFTSWFHEQVPFLEALSSYFANTEILLVSEGINLTTASVSSLIDQYVENVNNFPEFYISEGIDHGMVEAHHSLYHQCAGFLGVPGNLITCTIPHGLAQSEGYFDERQVQVPGDDVGCEVSSTLRLLDKKHCAESLGVIQFEKTFDSDQASLYLKRGVRLEIGGVNLTDMLIYPLLSYLRNPDSHPDNTDSRTLRLSPSQIIPRACKVLVSFYRDLWGLTRGDIPELHVDFILSFLTELHRHMGLPLSGVLQGRYVEDGGEKEGLLDDVAIKFPVDGRYLRKDPDVLFAAEEVEVFIIRVLDPDEVLTNFRRDLEVGELITVYQKRGWSFLEDMGYLQKIERRGGEKVVLVGEEAKAAYLDHIPARVSRYRVTSDISLSQLAVLDIIPGEEAVSFEGVDLAVFSQSYRDLARLRGSDLYSARRDWDAPSTSDTTGLDYGPDPDVSTWSKQTDPELDY